MAPSFRRKKRSSRSLTALVAIGACALGVLGISQGCDGSTLSAPPTAMPDPGMVPDVEAGSTPDASGGTAAHPDASVEAGPDSSAPFFDDGMPTRVACGGTLGSGLSPAHGRLDGTLVSIVTPQDRGCPSDADHLHLQVRMNGAIYDIAVNLDGYEGEIDAPLAGIPYAEGWHEMDLDYPTNFNLHSTAITLTGAAAIRERVVTALTYANHISVYGTGYPGSDGAHLIHRKVSNLDGALVINPLAAKAHVIAFRFDADTF